MNTNKEIERIKNSERERVRNKKRKESTMSSDDIEFESGTGEVMQDNTDETIKSDDLTSSTSQQALKQLNQLTANNSNISASKVTTATVAASTSTVTTSNLQNPKVAIGGAKIVYIKNPNGTQQQIRIGGSLIGGSQTASANNSNSIASASTAGLQKVQLVQVKNKNVVSASVPTTANRFVLKSSGNASQKIIFSSSGAPTKIGAGPSGTGTRTITVSQAQQMGLLKASSSPASTSNSTTTKTLILPASSSGAAAIALKNQPTILNKGVKPIQSSKILIQSDSGADSDAKSKTATTTSIVKVAGTNQQVRVVSQGGKGLQYVRVLNAIPSGSANSTTAKIVNGRQQPVIVQRKIVPQQGAQLGATGTKPQQFVTKKLEVMPIGSNAKVVKKEPTTQTVKTPTTYLLNNVQKNIVTSSIDIKPVTSNQSDSFEITETKDEPMSPSSAPKKFASRTYSLSTDRKSKSPEPNQSSLMYSTLKLPSPEPIEGIAIRSQLQLQLHISSVKTDFYFDSLI